MLFQKIESNSRQITYILLLIMVLCSCKGKLHEADEANKSDFTETIRSTEARTPLEEMKAFKLPDGFEIQLFASEPQIGKPINMAFDAQGRMWVTQSTTYPIPANQGEEVDKITILEDLDHDGSADRFYNFSDTLNVPIGVLPTTKGAIAYSIPYIYAFEDANHDDKVEQSRKIIGPFSFVDTHGMVSNFTRGYDGWVHACHGFTNKSRVAGTDGDSISLISGNTFRFKIDGSHAEQTTFGQVNPFGLVYDQWGYIYSTDSHSSPLYQLITGGEYPHFGKKEIMGFGPDMKSFENEATALAGIAYYSDTRFPKDFQNNFFVGDPLLSRVHRYSFVNNGSTPVGKSEEDFIISDDPWFRPVNITLGPDGAIYVADFYNAIIGHYEVPLGHPKRDKTRGRIWRITYKGSQNNPIDLTSNSLQGLIGHLDANNLSVRMLATNEITDRIGVGAIESLRKVLNNNGTSDKKYLHSLWALQRLGGLTDEILENAIVHSSAMVRVHTLRVFAEEENLSNQFSPLVLKALKDENPHVKRAAVETITRFSEIQTIKEALAVIFDTGTEDTHIIYTARLAIRNMLRDSDLMQKALTTNWNKEEAEVLAGILLEVPSLEAGMFLAQFFSDNTLSSEKTAIAYRQMAATIPTEELSKVIKNAMLNQRSPEEATLLFEAIQEGLTQRKDKTSPPELRGWGTAIVDNVLSNHPFSKSKSNDALSLQIFAVNIIGNFKISTRVEEMKKYFKEKNIEDRHIDLRTSIFQALVRISKDNIAMAKDVLLNDTEPLELRKKITSVLGEFPGSETNKILQAVHNVPNSLQVEVVNALANTKEGKDIILANVKEGKIASRVLIEPKVEERIKLNIKPDQLEIYNGIVSNLEPISEENERLIAERLEEFKKFKGSDKSNDSGRVIFNRYCSACHKRGNQIGIGPQLNGIGNRGAEAIIEKILDPNRNISEAFRNYTVKLKGGNTIVGLHRRDEGEAVIFADINGKEFSIARNDIEEMEASKYTLMPANFGETIPKDEFNLLLSYLLSW